MVTHVCKYSNEQAILSHDHLALTASAFFTANFSFAFSFSFCFSSSFFFLSSTNSIFFTFIYLFILLMFFLAFSMSRSYSQTIPVSYFVTTLMLEAFQCLNLALFEQVNSEWQNHFLILCWLEAH